METRKEAFHNQNMLALVCLGIVRADPYEPALVNIAEAYARFVATTPSVNVQVQNPLHKKALLKRGRAAWLWRTAPTSETAEITPAQKGQRMEGEPPSPITILITPHTSHSSLHPSEARQTLE